MTLLYDWLKTAAKARGNSKALVYRDNYLSWRGLVHRVDRRAQEFHAMGIKPGAWVGLMLGNVPDFVILALALAKLDATIVPIDPTTGSRELELVLAAAPLRALITRPRGSEGAITATGSTGPGRARPRAPSVGPPPVEDGEDVPEIRRRLQGTLLTCSVFKRPNPEFGVHPLAVLFTSDSLGDPKGILRTGDNMMAVVDNLIEALAINESSRILTAVPLFHAYGWDVGFLPMLRTGATMFLEEEISARRVAKILREHTVDILPGTPTMYTELCRVPTAKPLNVPSPRYLTSGARIDPETASQVADKYGIQVMSCYHSTEAGVVALDLPAQTPHSVGKPVPGIDVKLTDLSGAPLGSEEEGLIWLRGPSLARKSIGPFKDIDDAEHLEDPIPDIGEFGEDGWLHTGDMGVIDGDGRLFLAGREDHVVKVEGKRVALSEVEGCLESFPTVQAAQAMVVTDPLSGAMVVAKVVANPEECDAEELIDYCARNLAPYKVPRRIEFCDQL